MSTELNSQNEAPHGTVGDIYNENSLKRKRFSRRGRKNLTTHDKQELMEILEGHRQLVSDNRWDEISKIFNRNALQGDRPERTGASLRSAFSKLRKKSTQTNDQAFNALVKRANDFHASLYRKSSEERAANMTSLGMSQHESNDQISQGYRTDDDYSHNNNGSPTNSMPNRIRFDQSQQQSRQQQQQIQNQSEEEEEEEEEEEHGNNGNISRPVSSENDALNASQGANVDVGSISMAGPANSLSMTRQYDSQTSPTSLRPSSSGQDTTRMFRDYPSPRDSQDANSSQKQSLHQMQHQIQMQTMSSHVPNIHVDQQDIVPHVHSSQSVQEVQQQQQQQQQQQSQEAQMHQMQVRAQMQAQIQAQVQQQAQQMPNPQSSMGIQSSQRDQQLLSAQQSKMSHDQYQRNSRQGVVSNTNMMFLNNEYEANSRDLFDQSQQGGLMPDSNSRQLIPGQESSQMLSNNSQSQIASDDFDNSSSQNDLIPHNSLKGDSNYSSPNMNQNMRKRSQVMRSGYMGSMNMGTSQVQNNNDNQQKDQIPASESNKNSSGEFSNSRDREDSITIPYDHRQPLASNSSSNYSDSRVNSIALNMNNENMLNKGSSNMQSAILSQSAMSRNNSNNNSSNVMDTDRNENNVDKISEAEGRLAKENKLADDRRKSVLVDQQTTRPAIISSAKNVPRSNWNNSKGSSSSSSGLSRAIGDNSNSGDLYEENLRLKEQILDLRQKEQRLVDALKKKEHIITEQTVRINFLELKKNSSDTHGIDSEAPPLKRNRKSLAGGKNNNTSNNKQDKNGDTSMTSVEYHQKVQEMLEKYNHEVSHLSIANKEQQKIIDNLQEDLKFLRTKLSHREEEIESMTRIHELSLKRLRAEIEYYNQTPPRTMYAPGSPSSSYRGYNNKMIGGADIDMGRSSPSMSDRHMWNNENNGMRNQYYDHSGSYRTNRLSEEDKPFRSMNISSLTPNNANKGNTGITSSSSSGSSSTKLLPQQSGTSSNTNSNNNNNNNNSNNGKIGGRSSTNNSMNISNLNNISSATNDNNNRRIIDDKNNE